MAQFVRAGRNKWRVRYSAGQSLNGKRRVLHKTINGTKKDAWDWVLAVEKERSERGTVQGQAVIVAADCGSWLYALRMCIPNYEHCPIKVGITGDPERRKANFASSGPFPVEWIGCWPAPDGRFNEIVFHERFRKHRLCGEWFFPHEELLEAIQKALRDHNGV